MATFGQVEPSKSKPGAAPSGDDALIGRMGRSRSVAAKTAPMSNLSRLLDAHVRARRADPGIGPTYDRRQQAVVKIHYHAHVAGKRNGLAGHAAYVSRDDAARPDELEAPETERHTDYLTRDGREGRDLFYGPTESGFDGRAFAAEWAEADKRHFRIVLAPEQGAALGDLQSYTREVMARAEAALGKPLRWMAVDHWDTDNPHTHIILRGRDGLGRDLVIPREFVQHGLRGIARDVATERLGERTKDQARESLERETRRHAPTRLDRIILDQVEKDGTLTVAQLKAPNRDPALTQALKARAVELERLGLAWSVRRNVLQMTPGWHDRLKAMELHLDVAKRMAQARQIQAQTLARAIQLGKTLDRGR
jgi:type IV secretory pathway VirD2 relaxase